MGTDRTTKRPRKRPDTDGAPLYAALAQTLATAIADGHLPAGSRMPSLRVLARQHGLSLNTVLAAYRDLESRGLIAAHERSGYRVCSVIASPDHPLSKRAQRPTGKAQVDLMTQLLAAQAQPGMFDLAFAAPRGRRFYPTARLARHTAAVLRRTHDVPGRYALPPGSPRLRAGIARRAAQMGMRLAAESIVLTHGAVEALQLALRATTRAGDTVGIEAPSYFNLYPLLDSLQLRALEIPTHPRDGLDVDVAESLLQAGRLQALVVMPTVHNPLGCTMPVAHKRRLAALAARHRVAVIEDLVYAELQFQEPLSPAVKAFDDAGWVIACSGYSKTLAPDYRLGWVEGGRFTDAIARLKFTNSASQSLLLCEALAGLMDDGLDRHMRLLRRIYQQQVERVRHLVATHFPPGTRATQPAGGFLLWLELPHRCDAGHLFQDALAEGIVVMPGQVYSQGARYRHCLRLSCALEIDAHYESAIARLGQLAHSQLELPER